MKPTKLPLWKDKRIHWKKFFDQVEAGQSFVLPINHRHDETMGRQDIDELLRRFAPRRTRQLAAR